MWISTTPGLRSAMQDSDLRIWNTWRFPTLLFEHSSGGRLYQSGFQAVPEDLSELGISLIVAASKKYRRRKQHENVILAQFNDKVGMSDQYWDQIEEMVVPAVREMARTLEAGKGVLSVCREGINRASFLSALTIMAVSDLPPQVVIALIRARRGWDCLHNSDFRDVILYGFEARCRSYE